MENLFCRLYDAAFRTLRRLRGSDTVSGREYGVHDKFWAITFDGRARAFFAEDVAQIGASPQHC